MRRTIGIYGIALAILFSGCTLSRPSYITPDVHVGEPAFTRALEAHTLSSLVPGNLAQILLNGNEIFPAMLVAIREAKGNDHAANSFYEEATLRRDGGGPGERCRAGVKVSVLPIQSAPATCRGRHRTMLEDGAELAWGTAPQSYLHQAVQSPQPSPHLVVDGPDRIHGRTAWASNGPATDGSQALAAGPTCGWRADRALPAVRVRRELRETTEVLLGGDAYFPEPNAGHAGHQSVKSSPAGGAAEPI